MIEPAWRHATPVLLALVLVLPVAPPAAAQEADFDRFVKTLMVQGPDPAGDTDALRHLAEQGDAGAQLRLGLIYHEGQNVARDYSQAARWYREAAKQGHATAQLALAFMLNAGRGVAKDEMASFRWLSRAAEHGHIEAQFMLSVYHSHDMVRSHAWLIVAASQGHKIAISMLDVNRSIRPAEVVAQAEELATDLCQGMDNPSSC